jgi:hypothetical protein
MIRAALLVVAPAALLLLPAGCAAGGPSSPPSLALAYFESDATPPLGHRFVGWSVLMKSAEAPLLLKGLVLDDGRTRAVVAALDWCRLHGGAYDLIRRSLAAAASVPETRVALQCTHTHGAPIADTNAQLLLDAIPGAPRHLDSAFLLAVAERAADGLRKGMGQLRRFTHVAVGRAKVERYASSRRIIADGKLRQRMSSCRDAALAALPEGTVDPWLRTVTLLDGARPLVRLHYYATHPQSYYGPEASPDVPGFARERLEKEEGIPHLYFTGCGGDVAAGKYNDGSKEARQGLIDRLAAAMKEAIAASRSAPATAIDWKTAEVRFPLRSEPAFSEVKFRKDLADPQAGEVARLKAALAIAWYDRLKTRPAVDVSRLRIGPATILHLPGEAFVEYQLFSQSLRPEAFIAVAAYGEGAPGYICTDRALAEGGYEPSMSLVGPPTEARLKAAIEELLR